MVLRLGGKIKTRKNITTTNMVQIRITENKGIKESSPFFPLPSHSRFPSRAAPA